MSLTDIGIKNVWVGEREGGREGGIVRGREREGGREGDYIDRADSQKTKDLMDSNFAYTKQPSDVCLERNREDKQTNPEMRNKMQHSACYSTEDELLTGPLRCREFESRQHGA